MTDLAEGVDVPNTVNRLKAEVQHLDRNVLAYGALLRGTCPVVSWTAHGDEGPVEIMTDLSEVASNPDLLQAMANSHAASIHAGLDAAQELLNLLKEVMAPVAAPPVPVTAAPPHILPPEVSPQVTGSMAGPGAPGVLPVPPAQPQQPVPPVSVQPQYQQPPAQPAQPQDTQYVPPGQSGPTGGIGPHGG